MIVIFIENDIVDQRIIERAEIAIVLEKDKVIVLKDKSSGVTGEWPIQDIYPLIHCRLENLINATGNI